MADLVESVLKAYRVLRVFEPSIGLLTVREIAERTGIPRSTCHDLCATLAHVQMLESMPGGGYRLGAAQAWLGAQVFERVGLTEAAHPHMEALQRSAGVQVALSQYVPRGWMVSLHRIGPTYSRTRRQLGTRTAAYECIEGLALLSTMHSPDVQELLFPPDETRLGAPGIHAHCRLTVFASLRRCREDGYLTIDEPGNLRTLATPITDRAQAGIGTLSVTWDRTRMSAQRFDLAQRLRETAESIGDRLPGSHTQVSRSSRLLKDRAAEDQGENHASITTA